MRDLFSIKNLQLDITTLFLIGSNLVPLFGAIYLGWDVGNIILLYWLENIVIGVFNVVKLMCLSAPLSSKVFTALFFSIHYGIFTFAHGAFIIEIFDGASFETLSHSGTSLMWAGIGLAASHAISLLINFFGRGEYKASDVNKQMFAPYGRIFVLHIVIIIGGALVQMLGAPLWALIVLIAVKIQIDISAHNASHRKAIKLSEIASARDPS